MNGIAFLTAESHHPRISMNTPLPLSQYHKEHQNGNIHLLTKGKASLLRAAHAKGSHRTTIPFESTIKMKKRLKPQHPNQKIHTLCQFILYVQQCRVIPWFPALAETCIEETQASCSSASVWLLLCFSTLPFAYEFECRMGRASPKCHRFLVAKRWSFPWTIGRKLRMSGIFSVRSIGITDLKCVM